MNDPVNLVRSALPGAAWPAIPGPEAAVLLSLQYQLELSQWLPPERLHELQYRQLDALLRHAYETVPYHRERWRGLYDPSRPITPELFSRLPVLTRSDLQAHFDGLKSVRVPADHGPVAETRTSGSTGSPVRVLRTRIDGLMWQAVTLREHLWHRRDLRGKLAAIRQGVTEREVSGWGPATDVALATGPSVMLPIRTSIANQLEWLQRHQPDYLLTYPSNVMELARTALAQGIRMPRLREVRTFGELLPPEARRLAREAWGVPVKDVYSSVEAGYLALQCPEGEHYHVQSESVLVEVLDERGAPCRPGDTGRVVVTTLHSFAMPLVRYELADFAELGSACPCGRGLPVLRRIVGRVRNMLVTAAGERFWPALGTRGITEVAPVLQYQLVQKSLDLIEVRMVTAASLTPEQEDGVRRHLNSGLPAGFRFNLVYCDSIPRSAGGKFEDFVSEVSSQS